MQRCAAVNHEGRWGAAMAVGDTELPPSDTDRSRPRVGISSSSSSRHLRYRCAHRKRVGQALAGKG
jgi:hypothetical protein